MPEKCVDACTMKWLWTIHKCIVETYQNKEPILWDDLPFADHVIMDLKQFSPTIQFLTKLNADNFLKERYFPADGFFCHVEELFEIVQVNHAVVNKFPKGAPCDVMMLAMFQCKW